MVTELFIPKKTPLDELRKGKGIPFMIPEGEESVDLSLIQPKHLESLQEASRDFQQGTKSCDLLVIVDELCEVMRLEARVTRDLERLLEDQRVLEPQNERLAEQISLLFEWESRIIDDAKAKITSCVTSQKLA